MTPQTTNTRILIRGLVALLAVGALALAVIALTPTPADAFYCPADPGASCGFYSDATYSELVGGCSTACDGSQSQWGTITPHKACSVPFCRGNPPR